MFWRKSILSKLLLGIVVPIVLIFALSAVCILNEVSLNLTQVNQNELTARSQSAAYQVSEFFTQYMEVVQQMSCNEAVVSLLRDTHEPGKAQEAPNYALASASLSNILASDPNIALVWTADFDSGESIRSGGVVRGKLTDYDITARSWYKQTLEHQDIFITEPYADSSTGALVASIIQPIYSGSSQIGLVAIDLSVDSLKTMMAEHKMGETGFFALTTDTNNVIYHPSADLTGKNITELGVSDNVKQAFASNAQGLYTYTSENKPVWGYLSMVGNTGWKVFTGLPDEEFYQGYRAIQGTILIIFGLGLLLLASLIVAIAIGIVRPLKHLRTSAAEIAKGNLDVDVSVRAQDEVGQVSVALGQTVARLRDYIAYIQELSQALNQIADGNLNNRLTLEYLGEFAVLKQAINNISFSLSQTLREIDLAAQQVSSGSSHVAAGAQGLSQSTTEQAGSVEELTATVEQISVFVGRSAQSAQEARKQSEKARGQVETSNQRMQQMITAISDISHKSGEIGKIIKTIEDIAFQTNILALNAAVEAARAGTAGKGFAVVADEVRNLAGKSAEAAKNTTALIGETIASVENGTHIADGTAQAMLEVVENTRIVNALIDEISSASSEQAISIEQVSTGVSQIAAVVHNNSATAEQSAAASEELSAQADTLKRLVGHFQLRSDSDRHTV